MILFYMITMLFGFGVQNYTKILIPQNIFLSNGKKNKVKHCFLM